MRCNTYNRWATCMSTTCSRHAGGHAQHTQDHQPLQECSSRSAQSLPSHISYNATLTGPEECKGRRRVGEAHKAGVDRIDAHAQLGVLACERLGQMVLRCLAHIVRSRVRVDLDRAEAAQVHHRTILHAAHTSALRRQPWIKVWDSLTV